MFDFVSSFTFESKQLSNQPFRPFYRLPSFPKMQSFVRKEIETFYRVTELHDPSIKNPFKHRLHLTWSKKVELLFGFLFIFPLRLPVFIVVFLSVLFWSMVISYGTDTNDSKTPLPPWKRKLKKVLQLLTRLLLYICGFHKVRIKGKLASPEEAPICVFAPHSSFMDIMLMSVVEMVPSGLSKIENLQSPITAPLLMAIESIGVRRECPKSRLQSLEDVKYRTLTTRGQWPHLLICPEGTCTNRSALIRFKAGAFIPGCPVQPICVKYISKPDIYTWVYDGPTGIQLFMMIMCQLYHEAELELLPVRIPSQEELKNPKLFANNVREEMAKCLDVPTTGHSFEDCILMSEANRLGLPDDVAIVEYQSLSKSLGINLDYMKEQLETFAVIDMDKDGIITLEDHVKYHDLPICSPLKLLFSAFDPTEGSTIICFVIPRPSIFPEAKPRERSQSRDYKKYCFPEVPLIITYQISKQNSGQVTFRQYLIGSTCLKRIAAKEIVYNNALKMLQKYSKPGKKMGSVIYQKIIDCALQCIDDMFSNNNYVMSRNDQLNDFLTFHSEFTVLLSLLENLDFVDTE